MNHASAEGMSHKRGLSHSSPEKFENISVLWKVISSVLRG